MVLNVEQLSPIVLYSVRGNHRYAEQLGTIVLHYRERLP